MADFVPVRAIGLMSGTSLDGVDAALLTTDGETRIEPGPALTLPYSEALAGRLRRVLGRADPADPTVAAVARDITSHHVTAVLALLDESCLTSDQVEVTGFHGHTILHRPDEGLTLQIGDGDLLARGTGIDTIDDFRSADMTAGGQGAPFASLYHAALLPPEIRPAAVLNVGGVANVTWVGEGPDDLMALDTGPGNALLDDWAGRHSGVFQDTDGRLARAGRVDATALGAMLSDPWFDRPPPRSLDRDDFDPAPLEKLSPEDGAATLVAVTAGAVARAREFFPAAPRRWLVTGGGRHNPAMMAALEAALQAPVAAIDSIGVDGDALEAQAFAWLAVRSLRGLPLSVPATTGCRQPTTGGRLHRARAAPAAS